MKNISTIIAIILASFSFVLAQNIKITPLEINSDADDFASSITKRAGEMYFTSNRSGDQNLYIAKMNNGKWAVRSKVGNEVNSGSQNGSATLTPDGQYMIFASYESDVKGAGRTDLYSARKVDGDWTDVQNLGMAINSEYWDSQPSLSSDGNTLYFVSDRPADNGGTNIFYSQRTREGWSQAKELNSLNTDADEMSPSIAADGRTFTYSSNKSGGEGGFDIYFARLNEDFNSYNIENAGSVINTSYDEYFYVVVANTDMAFYSSSKPSINKNLNVYSVVPNPHLSDNVVFVHGIVSDVETKEPLGANIEITDLTTGTVVARLHSDDITGEYNAVLTGGRNYSITADKEGYLFYSENFNVPKKIMNQDIRKDIALSPIARGKTRLLIFFDFDKSTLQSESKPELARLKKFMNDNPSVNVELQGHTDDQGTDDYNLKLSSDRANAVKQYLEDAGVDGDRITTKGFGESQPLVQGTSDEARAKNRRVELVITSL